MSSGYILAVDLGTTNCKVLLLDPALKIVAQDSVEYGVALPQPGWSEQQPEDWWTAVRDSIRRTTASVDAAAIAAVGLSGQMHGLVLLNEQGSVLRPAILWNDQRSAAQCDEIYRCAGGSDGLLGYTNNPMLPGYTGGKILWVRDNEPEIFRQIDAICLPKDYIRYRLTGEIGTDESDASGTGLFDVRRRVWAGDLIARLGLPDEWFPPVHRSSDIVGTVSQRAADDTGLRCGTPVIAGGGDAVMQTVGAGAVDSDTVLMVIGTGGNVTVSTPRPVDNPGAKLQVFCHVIPDQWVAMGVTLTAGNSLKWFRDTLGGLETAAARDLGTTVYALLGDEAARSAPCSHGVLFLPYLQGERCPHTDVHARGAFVGLGLHTTKADVVRSVMEGVAFSLRDVLELIAQADLRPTRIHASGGGASSPVWRQILADVFQRPLTTLDHSADASAIGAGIIAGVATGFWASVNDAVKLIPEKTADNPAPENAEAYARMFDAYRKLYPALKPLYDAFAQEALPVG